MRLSVRRIVAGAAAALVLAACATPQTLVPYTPAAGVNNGPRAEVPNPGDDRKNYYVPESVGIATGLLIAALHSAGLATARASSPAAWPPAARPWRCGTCREPRSARTARRAPPSS